MAHARSPGLAAVSSSTWPPATPGQVTTTVVRVELVATDGTNNVSIHRELRCGDVVVAGGVVWTRSITDATEASDAFEGLRTAGDDLVYLAESALVLNSSVADAIVDRHVAKFVEAEKAARAAAATEAAKAEKAAARDRNIAVYFTGDKKRPVLELGRGPLARPVLKLHFGASWERDRFWDWFKWQKHRHEEIADSVAEVGAEPVRRELLYDMLKTEQAVKKRGLGAGGRRPLLFWRGDL